MRVIEIEPAVEPHESVLAMRGPWSLVLAKHGLVDRRTQQLAALFQQMFEHVVSEVQAHQSLPAAVQARIVLSGDESSTAWCVSHDATGFMAVCASLQEADDDESFYEVNDHNEAFINLEAMLRMIDNGPAGAETLQSALVTLPSEMLHVAEWLRSSGGRTPLQVYSQDNGVLGICAVFDRSEKYVRSHAPQFANTQDVAEEIGREIVEHWVQIGRNAPCEMGAALKAMQG